MWWIVSARMAERCARNPFTDGDGDDIRQIVGIRGQTLIVNFPGSPKAVGVHGRSDADVPHVS